MASKFGAADIATNLRREIAKGSMKLHDRLPAERQLAETYGVARGTVREALMQLAKEKYVQIRRGSGTFVTYVSVQSSAEAIENANPLELIDARFAIEPHICRLAVLYGRRKDFDLLDAQCERMEANTHDALAFAEADTKFHHILAESTSNSLLIWMINQINSVRGQDEWTRMRHLTLDPAIIEQYNTQHRQVLNAIRARAPERAASLMKDHLETARLSLTRASQT